MDVAPTCLPHEGCYAFTTSRGHHVVRTMMIATCVVGTLSGLTNAISAQTRGSAMGEGLDVGAHEIVANGVRLWYEVAGNRASDLPPVVFLHGGPGQGSHHFAALAGPSLEPSLRMVYLDQRGSGRSERPWTGDYAIPTLVDDLEALRVALGVPEIAIIAHSFGGLLALEYAATYPSSVSSMVIVAGLWDMVIQCRLRLETLASRRPEAYARVRGDTLRDDGSRRSDCDLEFMAFDSEAERQAYNNAVMFPDSIVRLDMERVESSSGLRNTGEIGRALFSGGLLNYRFTDHTRVQSPVLVVAGERDGAARSAGLRELARRLPEGQFLEYEDGGHFVYLDRPKRFAKDVIDFFSMVVDNE